MDTDYHRIQKLLSDAKASLLLVGAVAPQTTIADWVSDLTFAQLHEADTACAAFCTTRQWRAYSADISSQIYLRIEFALSLCHSMIVLHPEQGSTPGPDAETLHMMLIDYWHERGLSWALERQKGPTT